jgi:hypothetical protein
MFAPPFHQLWYDHPNSVCGRIPIVKTVNLHFIPSSLLCTSIFLFSYILNLRSSIGEGQSFTITKRQVKLYTLYFNIYRLFHGFTQSVQLSILPYIRLYVIYVFEKVMLNEQHVGGVTKNISKINLSKGHGDIGAVDVISSAETCWTCFVIPEVDRLSLLWTSWSADCWTRDVEREWEIQGNV